MDIKLLQDKLGNKFTKNLVMDTRTFLDVVNNQSKELMALRNELNSLKKLFFDQQEILTESIKIQISIANQIGALPEGMNQYQCPVCYPCEIINYDYFQLQWKEEKSIHDKVYIFLQMMHLLYTNVLVKESNSGLIITKNNKSIGMIKKSQPIYG